MIRLAAAAAAAIALTTAAGAQPVESQWRATAHATGTGYETGTFDQPIDGGLRIACLSDGSATLSTQIKGVAPTAGSRFLVIPATRGGTTQTFAYTAGADGTSTVTRARSDRQFGRLWAALQGGNNVTVRYADGSFAVQSLAGTRTTLPARPCGR